MNASRRGSAISALIIVLVLLLVGASVWYFVSDPFRTKVDSKFKQASQWTPDNIARDPAGYLDYVETQTKDAQIKLKASKIAIAQNRGSLTKMSEEARNAVTVGRSAMSELLGAYKVADADNSFPITWQGKKMEKETIKNQVVTLNKQIAQKENLLAKVDSGLRNLDAQESKIAEAEGTAQTQLAEITANRELLKVQSLTDDLKDKLISMQAAVTATVNTASETGSTVSLDQLTAQSQTTVDNTEFDKIMAKNAK